MFLAFDLLPAASVAICKTPTGKKFVNVFIIYSQLHNALVINGRARPCMARSTNMLIVNTYGMYPHI